MTSWARAATSTVEIWRHPPLVDGKRGDAILHLSGVKCYPLMPVDAEIRQRMALESPHELLQTFIDGALDIREGDLLKDGAVKYPIKALAQWPWKGSRRLHLVLEDLK